MNKRALLIGINEYSEIEDLQYSEDDAESIALSLRKNYNFGEDEIILLTLRFRNGCLKLEDVRKQFDLIKDPSQERLDLLVIGFWGHGFRGADGKRFLCVPETDANNLNDTALALEDVLDYVHEIKATKTVFFLDCCRNTFEKPGSIDNCFSKDEAYALFARLRKKREEFLSLDYEISDVPTVAILNSCSIEQNAHVWEEKKHGVFTYFLLEAFEKKLDTARECCDYVYEQMKARVDELPCEQFPFLIDDGGVARLLPPQEKTAANLPAFDWLWFVEGKEGKKGDYLKESALKQKVAAGKLKGEDYIYTPETGWVTVAEQFSGLKALDSGAITNGISVDATYASAKSSFWKKFGTGRNNALTYVVSLSAGCLLLGGILFTERYMWSSNAMCSLESVATCAPVGSFGGDRDAHGASETDREVCRRIDESRLQEPRKTNAFDLALKDRDEAERKRFHELAANEQRESELLKQALDSDGEEENAYMVAEARVRAKVKLDETQAKLDEAKAKLDEAKLLAADRDLTSQEKSRLDKAEEILDYATRMIAHARDEYDENDVEEAQKAAQHAIDWALNYKKNIQDNIVCCAAPENRWEQSSSRRAGTVMSITLEGVEYRFHWIPAGKFMMGSPESDEDRSDDDDQHEVTLTRGFWIQETETTQKQWKSIMGENPSKFEGEDLPVEQVSWKDVQEFIDKLNKTGDLPAGLKFRLPTEAEWEYACRAGEDRQYSGSNNLDEAAWYDENSDGRTHEGGAKKANGWGLYDMSGNVWEWCNDWYDADYYDNGPSVDPQGPSNGSHRVHRGGSWSGAACFCRCATRYCSVSDERIGDLGFRLVLQ